MPFIGLAMFLAIGLPVFAASASQAEQTMTGTVTCNARLTKQYVCQRNQTQQSCTLECVQRGFRYELLVDGSTRYLLEGNRIGLERFAGGKTTVTGFVAGNKIDVESVSKPVREARFGAIAQPTGEGQVVAAK